MDRMVLRHIGQVDTLHGSLHQTTCMFALSDSPGPSGCRKGQECLQNSVESIENAFNLR